MRDHVQYPILTKQMNLQQFILTINGSAALMAADGTYLGLVSSNQYDRNSICNPHGKHGIASEGLVRT